jgi:hypothetical protein
MRMDLPLKINLARHRTQTWLREVETEGGSRD